MATMDMASSITRHRSDRDVGFFPASASFVRRANPLIRASFHTSGRSLTQHVTHPAHGVDQPRFSFCLGLAPQIADVHFQRIS